MHQQTKNVAVDAWRGAHGRQQGCTWEAAAPTATASPQRGGRRHAFVGRNIELVATLMAAWIAACGADLKDTAQLSTALDGPQAEAGTTAASAEASGLFISELLPLPMGRRTYRQWLELGNRGSAPVCLDGATLQIGTLWSLGSHTLRGVGCVAPGAYVLLGGGSAQQRRAAAGLAVDADWGTLELPVDAGVVVLRRDATTLARLCYGVGQQAPAPVGGRALALQQGPLGKWCNVLGPRYDGYDQGSPGRQNPGCTCCCEGARWRAQSMPQPHSLTLEALLADPPGPDKGREWLTLRATATAAVDLAGLRLVAEVDGRPRRSWTMASRGCSPLAAGEVVRLPVGVARHQAPPPLPFFKGPTLPNRAARYTLCSADDTAVDEAWLPILPHHAATQRLAELADAPWPQR